jgi:hypothetical protein
MKGLVRSAALTAAVLAATCTPAFANNGGSSSNPGPQPTGTVSMGKQYESLCDGLLGLDGTHSGTINKYIVTRTDNVDGSATLLVKLWGDLTILRQQASVLDCLWIDTDGNGARSPGEGVVGAHVEGLVITADNSVNGRGYFSVTVPGAATKTVCDQAYGVRPGEVLPADAASAQWLYRTPFVCSTPLPPVEIPEAGAVMLLGLSGALTGAAVIFGGRRRQRGQLGIAG